MQRLIFEVSDDASRLAIYDFESRELMAEVDGEAWHRLFEELPAGRTAPRQSCCAFHTQAGHTIEPVAPKTTPQPLTAIARSLWPKPDATQSLLIAASTPHQPAPMATAASFNPGELAGRPSASPELKSTGRRKLWDVPHKYHCPIIGTCLTVDDLRRIAERTAERHGEPLSDFDIHVSFVAAADDKNPISIATHKALEKRFSASVRRYAKARDAEALVELWEESLATGDVPGGLWALMTHPRADQRVLTLAYEEVHMLSHQIGAGQRADLMRLTETRAQLDHLQRDFDNLQRRTRQQADVREARIRKLEIELGRRGTECADLRDIARSLREQLAEGDSFDLRNRITELERQVEVMSLELDRLRDENEGLRSLHAQTAKDAEEADRARHEAVAECQATERLLAHLLSDQCDICSSPNCSRRNDLEGRLVLCVGGRKQLVDQYRVMVAGCNGRFDHHDGGLEDNERRLESMLASADIVVCATDYVSHSAYYRTKRFCKRHEKPHVLLGHSGVSSFALAIENLAS
jgi:hypothetical protein